MPSSEFTILSIRKAHCGFLELCVASYVLLDSKNRLSAYISYPFHHTLNREPSE